MICALCSSLMDFVLLACCLTLRECGIVIVMDCDLLKNIVIFKNRRIMAELKHIDLYTDGACSGNPGEGGWAYVEVIPCSNGIKTNVVTGNKKQTTNNEMELTAVYMALVKALKNKTKQVTVYCDSAYVVNAITKGWLQNWHNNGWVTKEGKPIKNKHIWEKMYKLIYEKKLNIIMVKVKGHKGDPLNELADKSAVEAKQRIMEG